MEQLLLKNMKLINLILSVFGVELIRKDFKTDIEYMDYQRRKFRKI